MGLKTFLEKMVSRKPPVAAEDAEALRIDFKERYQRFKLLLSANSKALAAMADMKKTLSGSYPFSMSFVRSRCTSVSVNVYKMIQHLDRLAPGKYTVLQDRFREIQKKVDAANGGVAYSRNPVNMEDDSVFINAAWGLPKSVVDGTTNCDLMVVSRKIPRKVISKIIADKAKKYICFPEEGVCRMDLIEDLIRQQSSITEEQAISLAEITVSLEDYYCFPVYLEWVFDQEGKMFVLHCRPLMQKERLQLLPKEEIEEWQKALMVKGGITAAPGIASGKVYKIEKGADVLLFPRDAVLVVAQAPPRWAPLISRDASVITEQGGFAGHLANVIREFGIPGMFSVSGILEKINNGDMVTVDADHLTIYRGKIDLPQVPVKMKKVMAGSPVYETLKKAAGHIVPLNLLDPDNREFAAVNCKSFHDITRFIHENTVQEMFNFGKKYHFPERSSKQLHYNVPMQWWILNLDDGFIREVTGKYVHLNEIACVSMLAFWEGFAKIAWEGPPSMDGRGFASIMFGATTNTALTTGVRTKYSNRNYFMISKNYCSLTSRLGFHFSIMEAMVNDRMRENCISFQFKGGAANLERKLKRVIFIGDILEQYGFRVDINEDNLISRIEGREEAFMLDRLKILGYLNLHTHQLYMIMTSSERVAYYPFKIENDIKRLLKYNILTSPTLK